MKKIVRFFDKLEDRIRMHLARRPIVYAFIGGIGIVLFWKGVWEIAELVPALHGFGSLVSGGVILLLTGLLVSFFIGDSIIISGFKREKKLAEKTESEIRSEQEKMDVVVKEIVEIERDLDDLKRHIRY